MNRGILAPLFAAFLFSGGMCAAEPVDLSGMDLRFVDAHGSTGYYVDMNEVEIKNGDEATARVEIVRADVNRLYLYTIAFDRKKRTYQILDSIVAAYDTKEQTGGSETPLTAQEYAKGSAMEEVVEYIYSPQR